MSKPTITIMQLYPRDMNIYGDWGNVRTLAKRLEWRGFGVDVIDYNVGDAFPNVVDIIVGGGGQDSGQRLVQDDLQKIAPKLRTLADSGTPMLMICGLYQLFGNRFITATGEEIAGIGLFDAETRAGDERLIGNIVLRSDEFGDIIGYENHSGQTTLRGSTTPLGAVTLGAGNTAAGDIEGARYRNVIGTYLHGSLLPKNPRLADFLITKALAKHDYTEPLAPLEIDAVAKQARAVASKRPR